MKIPDLEGRMQILAMLVHKKKLADDVTIRDIAQGAFVAKSGQTSADVQTSSLFVGLFCINNL